MNSKSFLNEVLLVKGLTGANIEYSLNQTGNGTDADWILESNSENLTSMYFNENILLWKHTLQWNTNNTIYYNSTDVLIYFNVTNSNTGALTYHHGTYKLHKDVTINVNDNVNDEYIHVMLNEGEVFDGNGYTMTYASTNSRGLFIINGKSGSTKTTIKNLTVRESESNIDDGGGIVRNEQANFTVKNCKNYRTFRENCGGIVGSKCNNFIIDNCNNYSGIDDEDECGGIVGSYCSSFEVKNCKNKLNGNSDNTIESNLFGGIVGPYCSMFKVINCHNEVPLIYNNENFYEGGIVGAYCYDFSVKKCTNSGALNVQELAGIVASYCYDFKVEDCKNISNLNNDYCGGIVGDYCSKFEVKNCKNTGEIIGISSGGIVGNSCSNFEIKDCKNHGLVSGNYAGGIVGYEACHNDDLDDVTDNYVKIYNCVNYGNITGNDAGGIAGSDFGYIDGDNNNTPNTNLLISKCVNKGTVTPNINAGGICGSYLGEVHDQNSSESATILLEHCETRSGNLIGSNALQNDTPFPVPTKLIIKECYTHDKVPLIYGGAFDNTYTTTDPRLVPDTRSAKYIKKSGKSVNLLKHPTYVSRK